MDETFVCLQEGDNSCSGSCVEVTGHVCQGSGGAKTEEFILTLHGKPVCPLEEQGRGHISEMLCPLS